MAKRKFTKKYYFSVEGETERWYLQWLENMINQNSEAACRVSFKCPVQPDPRKMVTKLNIVGKTTIWHISDYESSQPEHEKRFLATMDNLKAACNMGKQVKYKFGYSNFTFELWVILHKCDFYSAVSHRKHYLDPINRIFNEDFQSLIEYKEERNFKRCLEKLELSDVNDAISRSKTIMKYNEENGYKLYEYKGYKYYKENPSLAIWEIIETILKDCKI